MDIWQSELLDACKNALDIVILDKANEIVVIAEKGTPVARAEQIVKRHNLGYSIRLCPPSSILEKGFLSAIAEGLSLRHSMHAAELFGFSRKVIVAYSLKGLGHSQKTMFGYALKGRAGSKGLLGNTGGEIIGRNCIMLPCKNLGKIREFMGYWKVSFTVRFVYSAKLEHNREGEHAGAQ